MLMELRNVGKRYGRKLPLIVSNIFFRLEKGETLAIFGDSGSGKSTIGQIVAGILPPSCGKILFHGEDLRLPYRGEIRRKIQILFQHPEVSFNPKMTLLDSMREPYRFFGLPYSREILCKHLAQFGIYDEHLDRYPSQLSGGELQRMALARIVLAEPELIVLDEPTSMLDVISQAQMIELLKGLQRESGVTYLFISHDPALCEIFCDRILHLEDGTIKVSEV